VIHDDFGTQLGPLMSLDHFRKFWKPLFRELFSLVHRFGAKTMMHSCGAVFDFIEDFIDMGADIVDPVQTTAEGMEPRLLKRRFGSDICFHGGIDTQQLLVSGSADSIRRHIDELFDAFGDTGYIIAPAHYIQGDVPLSSLIAMFEHLDSVRRSARHESDFFVPSAPHRPQPTTPSSPTSATP
jgi:uroporphyrinogen decarboxylase